MIDNINTLIMVAVPFVIVVWLGWVSLQVCDLFEELDRVKSTLIVVVNQLNEHGKQLDELRGHIDDDFR